MSDELDEARRLAEAQEWTAERLVRELDRVDLFGRGLRERVRAARDELVPDLKNAMAERRGVARMNAAVMLLLLGESDGTDGLVETLRDDEEGVRMAALATLSTYPFKQSRPGTEALPVKQEPLFAVLAPLLNDPASHAGGLALSIVLKLDLPEAEAAVEALVEHPSNAVRTKVVGWLAQRGRADEAIAALRPLLTTPGSDPRDEYWALVTLQRLAETGSAGVKRGAAELALRYVREHFNASDNRTANHVWGALRALEHAGHADERVLLPQVLASSLESWVRGHALKRLAALEGRPAGSDRLVAALTDPVFRQAAAEGLAKLEGGSGDARVLAALGKALEAGRAGELDSIVDALLSVGGPSGIESLDGMLDRLDPWLIARVRWQLEGIGPVQAAEALVDSGVIAPPSPQALAAIEAEWAARPFPFAVLTKLLEGRLTGFDCETATIPCDHAQLIRDLTEISRGVFEVESVSQQWHRASPDSFDGDYTVRFVHDGRAYDFGAKNLGDWYDVVAVIDGLRRALEDAGRDERFVIVPTFDQFVLVAFVPGAGYERVAAQLHFPLQSDPDSARKAGVAFERHVVGRLQGE